MASQFYVGFSWKVLEQVGCPLERHLHAALLHRFCHRLRRPEHWSRDPRTQQGPSFGSSGSRLCALAPQLRLCDEARSGWATQVQARSYAASVQSDVHVCSQATRLGEITRYRHVTASRHRHRRVASQDGAARRPDTVDGMAAA
jgi:hypothetical protein